MKKATRSERQYPSGSGADGVGRVDQQYGQRSQYCDESNGDLSSNGFPFAESRFDKYREVCDLVRDFVDRDRYRRQ